MKKVDFIKMCHNGQAARMLLQEWLVNKIKENEHANVEGITLTTELEVGALIRLVQENGEWGFDMLENYR